MEQNISESFVYDRLLTIIYNTANINITDKDTSLFSLKYNLSSELLIYILLIASKELYFTINDEFVESLKDYSYNNIFGAIMSRITN